MEKMTGPMAGTAALGSVTEAAALVLVRLPKQQKLRPQLAILYKLEDPDRQADKVLLHKYNPIYS